MLTVADHPLATVLIFDAISQIHQAAVYKRQ